MDQARQSIEAHVLERAARDPQFRDRLKQDPRGTVSREFGVEIPQDISVEVVEEAPTTAYLVLPPAPSQPGQEVSDQDLEAVAGGWSASTQECGSCHEACSIFHCYR